MVEESLIKKLMASIKCGVCGQRYEVDNINVLDHEGDLWFVGAFCSTCHTQCLVAAMVKEGKAPEVVTDLAKSEIRKFKNIGVPTADDVLDMHNFLKDFDGDFSRLFSQKKV